MDFQEFLKYVPKLLEVDLPASEAHYKMAPLERIESLKKMNYEGIHPKAAAVMMLFYPKNDKTHLVLIVRNEYKGVHSSQIAFPGGRYEIEDENFENTALRETHEEIGIAPSKMKIIRAFTQLYIQPSNFMVYPFLGISNQELIFIPEAAEVADIIELPLSVFLDDKTVVSVNISTSYAQDISVPAFNINDHIVWGATAMMLSELKDVLKKVL